MNRILLLLLIVLLVDTPEVMTAEPLEATFEVDITVGHHDDGRRYFLAKSR